MIYYDILCNILTYLNSLGCDSTGSMVSWRKSPWQDQTGTSHSNKAATPELVAKEGRPSLSAGTQLCRIESRLWLQEHANTLGTRGHHCASANVWNRQTMRNWNKLNITEYWIKWFKMNQTASTQGNLTIPDFFNAFLNTFLYLTWEATTHSSVQPRCNQRPAFLWDPWGMDASETPTASRQGRSWSQFNARSAAKNVGRTEMCPGWKKLKNETMIIDD